MYVVCALKDLGWTAAAIHDLLNQHLGGIAGKVRIRRSIAAGNRPLLWKGLDADQLTLSRRSSRSTRARLRDRSYSGTATRRHCPLPGWCGTHCRRRAWPSSPAQYATGKTFVGADVAGSVLTGLDFMGQEVCRRGGVLWLAAEGEAEVEARLGGVMNGKLRVVLDGKTDLDTLAFARQKFDVPSLTAKDAQTRLAQLAAAASDGMKIRFDVPLALIVIDTLAAAAGFDDENNASEAQRVFEVLKSLSRSTGTLIVAIDHYGKTVETGPRGSTAKGAAADAILSVLADKDQEGEIKNRRLAVTKLRNGPTGRVVPFDLRQTPIPGTSETTCFVEWHLDRAGHPTASRREKSPWSGRTRILKRSMETVLRSFAEVLQPSGEAGPIVSAADRERVRDDFYSSLPVTVGAKRKAFHRAQEDATGRGLIMCREIGGREMLWFRAEAPSSPQRDRPDSPYRACPVRPGADEDKRDKCPPCPVCPGAEDRDDSACGDFKGAADD